MSDADRMKWDAKWAARGSPGEPSPFVRSLDGLLPRAGRALDVAGGAGRHAIWLARRGLEVTLVDVSPEALRLARAAAGDLPITTLELDLDVAPLPAGPFELILCFHFLDRRVYGELPARLAPGGLLVAVHPTRLNLERHPSPAAPYLVEPGELPALLPGLEIVRSEEGWLEESRHEARLVARRAPG
jgi:tellurite methyltransferase